MNKVEELLLKVRKEDFEKKETAIVKSEVFAKVLGLEEPVDVQIEEVSQRKVSEIMSMQITDDGKIDKTKMFDAQLMLIVEGVKDPSMKSEALLKHFDKATPKELAEFLFKTEINELHTEISKLCGLGTDVEKKVKN